MGSHPIVNQLVTLRHEITAHESALEALYVKRTELLAEGVRLNVPSTELAWAAEVSRARVSQVAPRPKATPVATGTPVEREPGGEKSGAVSRAVPGIETVLNAPVVSDRYSAHKDASYGWRKTMWADVERRAWVGEMGMPEDLPGGTLAEVLAVAKWLQVTRVFLVGAPPAAEGEHGDAGIRAWFLADPGPGWSVAETGHHLADARTPTARYLFADGLAVEVMRTAAWWGESEASVSESRAAWFALQEKVQESFGDSARLLATPAVTGRDLWQRTIGPKTTYPVLSDEIRELIHATAGQGRIELLPPRADRAAFPDRIPGVHVRDGRLMYAALTWGMPVGPPTLLTAAAIRMMPDAQLRKAYMSRSRWHVRVQVPHDWRRPFGLLMAPREGGQGWRYPNQPGEVFETWCDGAELALALEEGWRPELLGGMTWKEGKPLNVWTEKLLAMWNGFEGHSFEILCRRAIRSLILFAIGAFASRGRTSTFTLPEDQSHRVPAGVVPSRAGGMLVWTQDAPATGWSAQLAHPEWSAAIWARARVRLLDGPGVREQIDGRTGMAGGRTGALYLPPGVDVIAFRTDALVLTGDPGWADDGKPGRLRYDGELIGPRPWPETEAELLQLKTAAQNRMSQ